MSKFKVVGHDGLVDTAKEVQKLLGGNIKMKDILAGTIEGVTLVDDTVAPLAPEETVVNELLAGDTVVVEEVVDEPAKDIEPTDEFMSDVPEHKQAALDRDKADELEIAKALLKQPSTPAPTNTGDVEFPEVGAFADKKAMKKFVKKLSDDQLFDWLDLEGVLFTPCDHEAINRMRAAMAITDKHFPKDTPTATKSKSKYANYTDEQLIQMAADKNIVVADAKGDSRIRRMYTIMALKAAGHLA